MSEMVALGRTALLTVAIFVIGQLLQRIFIEPIQEIRRTRGKIAHALLFYANFIHRTPSPFEGGAVAGLPPDEMKEASDEIRKLAADLKALTFVLPVYGFFAALGGIPSIAAVERASQNLIGWSNSLGDSTHSGSYRKEIADALKLKVAGLVS